jgi:hypothetical protein
MLVACKDRGVCEIQSCEHYEPHKHHQVSTSCGSGACSYADPEKIVKTWCIEHKEKEPTWVL